MRISDSYVIREIIGTYVIVPTGEAAQKFQGLISVNEVGALIWTQLQRKDMTIEELTACVCAEYAVEKEKAREDVIKFVQILKENDMLAED